MLKHQLLWLTFCHLVCQVFVCIMGVTRTDWKVCCLHYLSLRWVEMSWQRQPGINSSLSVDQKPGKKVKRGKNKGKTNLRGPKKQETQKKSAIMGFFSHFSFLFRFSTSLLSLCTLLNSQMCVFSVPCLVFMSVFHTRLLSSEKKRILLSGMWYIYIHHEKLILPYYSKA